MRVFITGSTGFVGRHVVRDICVGNHDVLALLRTKDDGLLRLGARCVYGDLSDIDAIKSAIRSFDPEVFIHLAWQGIPDFSERVSKLNLDHSIALCDFVIDETRCQHIMVAGSCFEYGKSRGICKESDPVRLGSFFSWAKYSLYRYLMLKCELNQRTLNWFRVFYVYGSGQRDGSLVPTLIQAFKDDEIPDIRSPLNKNDFVYIKDVARAFRLAIERKPETGIYNLGSGQSKSVHEICMLVEQCLQKDDKISNEILKRGSNDGTVDFWADTERVARILGWRPDFDLEAGIADFTAS